MLEVPREALCRPASSALAYLDLDLDVSGGGTRRYLLKAALTAKLLQAAEIKARTMCSWPAWPRATWPHWSPSSPPG